MTRAPHRQGIGTAHPRRPASVTPLALVAGLLVNLLATQVAGAQVRRPNVPLPPALKDVVFGGGKQDQFEVPMGGHVFRAVLNLGKKPALAWPAPSTTRPKNAPKKTIVAHDRQAARTWLASCDTDLGLDNCRPRFRAVLDWRGTEVWEYDLLYQNRVILDARVQLFFDEAGTLVGLSSTLVPPDGGVDPAPAATGPNEAWYTQPDGKGYRLVLATLDRRKTATHTITTVKTKRGIVNTIYESAEVPASEMATIVEYPIPTGTFPDQIFADSKGIIWFSRPLNNELSSFDPETEKFTRHAMTGGAGPDGMMVDDKDRVWTGLYNSGHLGALDIPTETLEIYPMSYHPSAPAIPTLSGHDTIWVTDHVNNRISEFDPATKKWLGTHVMPTPACWVVAGVLDPGRDDMYFTEFYGNAIGVKPLGKPIIDIKEPNRGGPAFLAFRDDKVYVSLWNQARLVEYDVVTAKFNTYRFPMSAEIGGPMAIAPNGDVVVGTRRIGYIMIFHPESKTFTSLKIPTVSAGLKDGLTVSPDGAVWFTLTGRNKLGKVKLP